MNVVKVAFVGSGGIATSMHLPALLKMDDVEVVAACDMVEEKAMQFAQKAGGACAYTDYIKMFDNEALDAVFICVPPNAHPDIELEAIKRKINVFIEKPMTTVLEQAYRVNESIAKNGVISAVGFQDRYLDVIDNMKQYINDKKVGVFNASWMGGVPGVAWWRKKDQSGGQVVEQNIHLFDMARYLFGEVDTIYATAGKGIVEGIEGYDIEDYSIAVLTFKSGVTGTFTTGCYISAGQRNGMDIFTDIGRASYKLRSSVTYYEKNKTTQIQLEKDNEYLSDRAFIEAVKYNDSSRVRSPYSDALKSLEVAIAVNESMDTGLPVKL